MTVYRSICGCINSGPKPDWPEYSSVYDAEDAEMLFDLDLAVWQENWDDDVASHVCPSWHWSNDENSRNVASR